MAWTRARAMDVPGSDVTLSPSTGIDPGPVLGTWVNYDPDTTGIARLRIRSRSGGIGVSILAAGSLWPEYDGESTGLVFASAVDGISATGFSACLGRAGTDVFLAAYLNLRLLVVDAYAVRPGSTNHFHRDHFYQP